MPGRRWIPLRARCTWWTRTPAARTDRAQTELLRSKGLLDAADIGKLACPQKPEGCSFPLIACPPVRLGACTLAALAGPGGSLAILAAALDEYKAAEEAYEPHWRRVRMSRIKTSKPKTKKAA